MPQMGGYGENEQMLGDPECHFQCIPLVLPFRPARVTPKPVIYGTQTAVVVGPAGEEIFTDKYGRVKVQFLWDRALGYASNSSSWGRLAMPWPGKNFGFLSSRRIANG